MKLSKLYCHEAQLFGPILFNSGLNVIHALVTRPKESDKDSHNLGKTLLIHVIDFVLLKGFDKGFFLYDQKGVFAEFVFYLEIALNDESFVTIRRAIKNQSKVSIKIHKERHQDFSCLEDAQWTHSMLPFDRAKRTLDGLLDLKIIAPWDYRKGCGYFLRTQVDYLDVFQIGRFSKGRDSDWKPFMAKLLGINDALIKEKYEKDTKIAEKESEKEDITKATDRESKGSYDRIKGLIDIKTQEIAEAQKQYNRFDFYSQEQKLNMELVDSIEQAIAEKNQRRYVVDYEISKIKAALDVQIGFDVEQVARIFKEAQIAFPVQLKRSYDELLEFNRALAHDRNGRLSAQLAKLEVEQSHTTSELVKLNARREDALSILSDTNSLEKFRKLQGLLVLRQTELARLQAELEQLDEITKIDKQIQNFQAKRLEVIDEIEEQIKEGNITYTTIRHHFNAIIKKVLTLAGLISIGVNREGNLEFSAQLHESDVRSSQDKGNSYRKFLCCAFDMALLLTYEKEAFFRFVYHDGVFEGFDNRKKRLLLEVVRDLCENHNIQYILTVLDADIPRDENEKRLEFSNDEIILRLWEGDEKGRLFRIHKF